MRQPMYARNNPRFRIISVPNGLWRLQELGGTKPTKDNDPWHNMSPALAHEEAASVLSRYHREKAETGN